MKTFTLLSPLLVLGAMTAPLFAQDEPASPAARTDAMPSSSPAAVNSGANEPNQAEMMKQMVEMSKTNDNHKLLAATAGTWNYTVKMWMNPDPNAQPQTSKGTGVRKMMMDGRYLQGEYTGKMEMPGPDGKMKEVTFKGVGIEGYDNARKKFVASWIDNMGTGIAQSEGSYDPTSKTFTYTGEMEPFPGGKEQFREVIKLKDNDHMMLEWYESHGGQEKKTMEIDYTRTGKG